MGLSGGLSTNGTQGGAGGAPLASPAFTGTPTAPSAASTINTTQLATMQAVQRMVGVMATSIKSPSLTTPAVGGAKIVTDAAITAAQSTVTSAQAAFTNADVNKLIFIEGAGANIAATSPTLQSTLIAQIQSVNAGVATIQVVGGGALTATTSVTNATAYFGVDDSAAFLAALQAGPVYVPTDNYMLGSSVTVGQTIEMYGDGFGKSVILAAAAASVSAASHLLVRGSAAAAVTVSADIAAGATSFTTTANPGVATGDYIALADGTQALNTWPGATSNTACRGEMLRVSSVTGAGPFTVNTAGLIHDQYLVNNAAKMYKLSMLAGVRIEDVEFRCTTPYTQLTSTSSMVWLEWCVDAYAKVRVRGNPGPGFRAGSCWDGDFYVDAEDLKDGSFLGTPATLGWWGYGAFASMCDRDCRYFVNAKRVRHAWTCSGGSSSAQPSIQYGVPRNIHVDGIASDCTEAAWDTHADGSDIHFGKIDAHGCLHVGLQVRAPRTTIGDASLSFCRHGGVLIQPASTQDSITANGAIAVAAGVATTSGQAAGVVLVTGTTAALVGLPAAGVLRIGGTAIAYTSRTTGTLSGCTVASVASTTVTTGSEVLVTQDPSGNILSHAVNCHIMNAHIHDIFTSGSAGKGIDCYAPYAVVENAYIHDIDDIGVWLRGTGSSTLANCKGFYFNGRIINPSRGGGFGVNIEQAPADVVLKGYIDLANSGIENGGSTLPPRLDTSGLTIGGGVTHPSADNFSSAGYGLPKTPVGRSDSRAGESTLVGGTVAVTATSVTANSIVVLTRKTAGGTLGHLSYTISAGASFTITSSSGTDTSVIQWAIMEKGAT